MDALQVRLQSLSPKPHPMKLSITLHAFTETFVIVYAKHEPSQRAEEPKKKSSQRMFKAWWDILQHSSQCCDTAKILSSCMSSAQLTLPFLATMFCNSDARKLHANL